VETVEVVAACFDVSVDFVPSDDLVDDFDPADPNEPITTNKKTSAMTADQILCLEIQPTSLLRVESCGVVISVLDLRIV
jgi:hypothetical protein